MPNEREFRVRLDDVDVAFLGTRNDIPGDTIEEKIAWIVKEQMREVAESVLEDR